MSKHTHEVIVVLTLQNDRYLLRIRDEPLYTARSTDNKYVFDREYFLGDYMTSKHGVECQTTDGVKASCILFAGGGGSTVHDYSAILLEDRCLVAVGNSIVAIQLPKLDLIWHSVVDMATCFGVYYSHKHQCIISHGECEITRLSESGKIVWSYSGRDIFSEGFILHEDIIEVRDFNNDNYLIDIHLGEGWLVE
jgi:hypothetical protein